MYACTTKTLNTTDFFGTKPEPMTSLKVKKKKFKKNHSHIPTKPLCTVKSSADISFKRQIKLTAFSCLFLQDLL